MILVDFNQIVIAATTIAIDESKNSLDLNEGLVRNIAMDSIRANRMQFYGDYGELIICCDDTDYWRKQSFHYYKARRAVDQAKSKYDWNLIYKSLIKIREEIRENFPYKVIQVRHAEADDIIASIVMKYGVLLGGDPILILSGDEDFKQLQRYSNVKQYDPIRNRWLECQRPARFLNEHIIRGDSRDGVPNIRSQDDVFLVDGIRQKPIMTEKLERWLDALSNGVKPEIVFQDEPDGTEMAKRFHRNTELVDLFEIPTEIQKEVIDQFHADIGHGRERLFDFFIKYNLKTLTSRIGDF